MYKINYTIEIMQIICIEKKGKLWLFSPALGLSRMRKIRSNRDNSVGGNLMFSTTLIRALYRDSTGLAEARMEVRALSVATIPALVMLTYRGRAEWG